MGFLTCDLQQLEAILDNLKKEYSGKSYHILTRYDSLFRLFPFSFFFLLLGFLAIRNCNHFSDELCYSLLQKGIPSWINRAPWLASMFPCLIPAGLIDMDEGIVVTLIFSWRSWKWVKEKNCNHFDTDLIVTEASKLKYDSY